MVAEHRVAQHPRLATILAATNRQLAEAVREGSCRADLYHRLSVYPVAIPPLRERGRDVLVLAGHFLEINRTRLGVRSLRLSPDAEERLLAYAWPGNVCELEHVISRAVIKALSHGARRDEIITLEPAWSPRGEGAAHRKRRSPLMRAVHRACASAWRGRSGGRSARPSPPATAAGQRPRGAWNWPPATCTSWPGGWG